MKSLNKFLLTLALVIPFTVSAETLPINLEKSKVEWRGSKVLIPSSHNGTLNFKSGSVNIENGKLTAGEFVVDMNSLENLDQSGDMKAQLMGHLKSDDFFGVAKFPTAQLKITKLETQDNKNYSAVADLTIKGITKAVNFSLVFSNKVGNAKVTVDRSKYDVKFGSESIFGKLGDKAISDNFELTVNVVL